MEGRSSQRRTKAEEAEGFRVRGLHLRLEKDVPIFVYLSSILSLAMGLQGERKCLKTQ